MSAAIYLHPKVFARRGADIARAQGGKIEHDACGRPFVRGADPLAATPAAAAGPPVDPEPGRFERFARLIEAIRALGRDPGPTPGRFHIRRVPR